MVLVKIKQNRYIVIEQQTIGTTRKRKYHTHTVTYGVFGVYVIFSKTILGSSSFFIIIINKRCFTHQFFGPSFFSCSFSKTACHDLRITLFLRCFFTYVLTRYKLYVLYGTIRWYCTVCKIKIWFFSLAVLFVWFQSTHLALSCLTT